MIIDGTIKTKALQAFIKANSHRVTRVTIDSDGVWLFTDNSKWCDDHGSGTFRGDSEAAAMRRFNDRITKAQEAA